MGLSDEYVHEVINHAEAYAKNYITTNGIENFWSLLKRGLGGTYVSVEPFHLFRYLDEQMFRFNNRATRDNPLNDSDRFALALSQIVGKRTYSELTGKEDIAKLAQMGLTDNPSSLLLRQPGPHRSQGKPCPTITRSPDRHAASRRSRELQPRVLVMEEVLHVLGRSIILASMVVPRDDAFRL